MILQEWCLTNDEKESEERIVVAPDGTPSTSVLEAGRFPSSFRRLSSQQRKKILQNLLK